MASLEQYLYDMEALPEETISAAGLVVLPLAASTTGTCGVTTPEAGLPLTLPAIAATGTWPPLGSCVLPTPTANGAFDAWHPAWGAPSLPLPEVTAQGSPALLVDLALTPLFCDGRTGALGRCALPAWSVTTARGATAVVTLPVPAPYALSGLDRTASLADVLPRPSATAWSCGLDDPVTNAAASDTVVALLCQDRPEIALAATSLAGGASLADGGADALAGTLLAAVAANVAYAGDTDDVWTCALGTYTRGTGDCEDGAILLHALLLAAGFPADRLVTVFGRVGVTRLGHAWVVYRRQSDGNWVVLDWTAGASPVANLPPIAEAPYYAQVDYALTAQAFFPVRQQAATFFPLSLAVALPLPPMLVAGEAVPGGRAACALERGWLRASALAAATAATGLPHAKVAARAGANLAGAPLPILALSGRVAPMVQARLSPLALTASAPGAWGRAGLALRPGIEARATSAPLARGLAHLARVRASATGLDGFLADGAADWPRARLVARGWPGGLAKLEMTLGSLCLDGRGLATTPGSGDALLSPLAGRGLAETMGTLPYRWHTTTPEVWS